MVQALTSWRYRTPVPCLDTYPGYAANWGRPTNDTPHTEFHRDRGCCRRTKAPPRFGASDSGQRGLKELFVRVLVAPSLLRLAARKLLNLLAKTRPRPNTGSNPVGATTALAQAPGTVGGAPGPPRRRR